MTQVITGITRRFTGRPAPDKLLLMPDSHDTIYLTAEWVLPVIGAPIREGYVALRNGRIEAVGAISQLPRSAAVPRPRPGTLLTPGLVNTHLHLEQSFPQPIPKSPDGSFTGWLLEVIAKTRQAGQPEAKTARCAGGTEELLRTGTTCVNDIASGTESFEALSRAGLRGVISLEVFHPGFETVDVSAIVQRFQAFSAAFDGHPLLSPGLSPHSPYNVSPVAWRQLLDACQPARVHTHLAEFVGETTYLRGETGSGIENMHRQVLGRTFRPQIRASSSVRYLHQFGLLDAGTVLAHAVHTGPGDRQIIHDCGAAIAHCPRSNLNLHGQSLRADDWVDYPEIPMGLGTDGRLSTENLDLRAEACRAMQLHGWDATEALRRITWDGARVLGLDAEIGALTPGRAADLVLWQAGPDETASPEARLLDPATRARAVWVAGELRWGAGT